MRKSAPGIDVQDIRIYDNFLRGVRQQIKRKREELLEIKKEEEKTAGKGRGSKKRKFLFGQVEGETTGRIQ